MALPRSARERIRKLDHELESIRTIVRTRPETDSTVGRWIAETNQERRRLGSPPRQNAHNQDCQPTTTHMWSTVLLALLVWLPRRIVARPARTSRRSTKGARPRIRTVPESAFTAPTRIRISVVFPAPLGPTRPTISLWPRSGRPRGEPPPSQTVSRLHWLRWPCPCPHTRNLRRHCPSPALWHAVLRRDRCGLEDGPS